MNEPTVLTAVDELAADVRAAQAGDAVALVRLVLPAPGAGVRDGNELATMVGFLAMSRQRAGRVVIAGVAAALLLAACGGSPPASVDPGARPELPVADAAVANQLPKVTVWDVGEKQWVQFGNFLPADKPVLVWFWAPH